MKGSSLKSGMIRFAALKSMLASSCISLHQVFIAHLYYMSGIMRRMYLNGWTDPSNSSSDRRWLV